MGERGDITELLQAWRAGAPDALERLLPLLYDELRRIARAQLRHQPGGTLQPTALVHEALIKLLGSAPEARDREHFLAVAARAMRQVLVDRARRKQAQKRGEGAERDALDDLDEALWQSELPLLADVDLLALDQALARFEREEPLGAKVVELRVFVGCSIDETARALDIHPSKANREWDYARAWLRRALGVTEGDPGSP